MSENGMDRPCSRPASEHACVGQQKEHHAMPKSSAALVTIGIDPGKNTLHLVGLDARGGIVLREKVARTRIVSRLANVPPCLIGIEAGMGTHYVTRELLALGHDVRQVPPVYAKPFRRTHKNDFRDAHAIAEAVQRPTTRCVRRKRTSSSICRRCIVCAPAWWRNEPRSSIRSAAFSWSTAS